MLKRALIMAATLVFSLSFVVYAQQGNIPQPQPGCPQTQLAGQTYPTNGLEPDYPIWCYAQTPAGPATRHQMGQTWIDSWDNSGPAIQTLNDHDYDYRVFKVSETSNPNRFMVGSFINTDHWMLDMARTPNRGDESTYRLSGGVLVSPDETFQFVNGKFIVEVDAAAGSDAMGGADAFYEIDVSPATAPTGIQVDGLYGYGSFGGVGALGCRLETAQDGPHTVCSMYDNSRRDAGGTDVTGGPSGRPGRVWETQGVGTARTAARVEGGYPDWPIPDSGGKRVRDVWRTCATNEHDLHCRDRFRLEIDKTSVHLYANGYLVMIIEGLYAQNPETGADNRIPDSWFQSGVRPYFTSWLNGWTAANSTVRWHWNDVLVNPTGAPGHSISYCEGSPRSLCAHQHIPGQPEIGAATSGGTATPLPVATATSTSLPTQTPLPSPTATAQPTATRTPTVVPTATATATPTRADVCTVSGLRNGVPETFPFACPPLPAFMDLAEATVTTDDAESLASAD